MIVAVISHCSSISRVHVGHHGAILPDILEPALHSHHRSVFHSLAAVSALSYGLKKANENPNYGIRALSILGGFVKKLEINSLVFIIAPRVNAAGRMDDGKKAVMMFVAKTVEEAMKWAEELHKTFNSTPGTSQNK